VTAAGSLAEGLRALVAASNAAWSGARAAGVRLLPSELPYGELVPLARSAPASALPVGVAEEDLGPVCADFSAEPHFLIFGDTGSGKSNLLRVLAAGVTSRLTPAQARLIIIDYRRSLLEAAGSDYLIGYAPSASTAAKLAKDAAEAMRQRLPGPDVTPAQLRERSWWRGPELFFLVDDYDLVATQGNNPLAALLEVLPHSRDVGLHVIVARASGGAGRAGFEPVMQRLRELGSPGILLSGTRDEGHLLGSVSAQPQPPGRGTLVTRARPPRLIQTALLPPVS
jgi:S-DNA-T family DNA segregation ATPase FtsK/SpoIIIE